MKKYKIDMEVLTGVCVKSGDLIKKFECIHDGDKIHVVDNQKLFKYIIDNKREESFDNFILQCSKGANNSDSDLKKFLVENRIFNVKNIEMYSKYSLMADNVDVFHDIHAHIRDSLTQKAYIPGSTIKGGIRSAIMAMLINKKNNTISNKEELNRAVKSVDDELKKHMQGISIADSTLVENQNMSIQSIYHYNPNKRSEKSLNVKFEVINCDTKLNSVLSIDESKTNLKVEDIVKAVRDYDKKYQSNYLKKVDKGDIEPVSIGENECKLYIGAMCNKPNRGLHYQTMSSRDAAQALILKDFKKEMTNGVCPVCQKTVDIDGYLYENGQVALSFTEIK